jgi:hypothetical protein
MGFRSLTFVSAVVALVSSLGQARLFTPIPPRLEAIQADPVVLNSTFQQLIDHANPSLGNFSQQYWYTDEFWAGPGSPVSSISFDSLYRHRMWPTVSSQLRRSSCLLQENLRHSLSRPTCRIEP